MIKEFFADKYKRNAFIAVLLAGGFVVFLFLSINSIVNTEESIDVYPEDGTSQDYTNSARVVGGEQLLVFLEGLSRYDSFTEDLKIFAESNYSEYKGEKTEVVGFEITSELTTDGDKVSFSGKYGSAGGKIEVRLEKLKNERLKASIKDGDKNIDDSLPSNSDYNKFVASLPKYGASYSIEYITNNNDKDIAITLDVADPELGSTVLQIVETAAGKDYDRTRVNMTFPLTTGQDFR